MDEWEKDLGRQTDDAVAPPADTTPTVRVPEGEFANQVATEEEALYRSQMGLGILVQEDFEEALAALAK